MQKIQWINSEKYKGVRWYFHESRKHGAQLDRCFGIRYQVGGKRIESVLGWASSGITEKKAMLKRELYIENYQKGAGPVSAREETEIADRKRQVEAKKAAVIKKESITFGGFFKNTYKPVLQSTKKTGSKKAESILFEKWIDPVIGKKPFKEIYPLHIERIRQNMLAATKTVKTAGKTNEIKSPRSARSIEYAFAVIRQVWNMARRDGLIDRESPTREVKKPKVDNKRVRFLTHDEADLLLEDLQNRSKQLHDMALLSLHTGMRAKEIFTLKWANLDFENDLINIFDSKGGSRPGHMTKQVKDMLQGLEEGRPNELVFQDRNECQIKQISKSFERAVDDLGFNEGITDPRQKVLFHTLRHTYASWLVQGGEHLFTVQKLMGHASISMTERYSHLAPDQLKTAVRNFEKNIREEKKKRESRKKKVIKLDKKK